MFLPKLRCHSVYTATENIGHGFAIYLIAKPRRSNMEEGGQIKRWTAARKIEVVLRLLKGESIDKLSRELGVEAYLIEEWHSKAIQGMEVGLKMRSEDPVQHELDHAKKRLGELMMENELLQIKANKAPGFRMGRSKK